MNNKINILLLVLFIVIVILVIILSVKKEKYDILCDSAHCRSNIHTIINPQLPMNMF